VSLYERQTKVENLSTVNPVERMMYVAAGPSRSEAGLPKEPGLGGREEGEGALSGLISGLHKEEELCSGASDSGRKDWAGSRKAGRQSI
jgi:hypothetical protein